jgi:hypothetical protein
LNSSGRVSYSVTLQSTGVYFIEMSAPHPAGQFFCVTCNPLTGKGWSGFGVAAFERSTNSAFWIVIRNNTGAKLNLEASFMVLT